jgi:hypothetical protein
MFGTFFRRVMSGLERRESVRHESPTLVVVLGKQEFTTADWSLGGFRIAGVAENVFGGIEPTAGTAIKGTLRFGPRDEGEFAAEIVRLADGELRAHFTEISPKVFLPMAGLGQ